MWNTWRNDCPCEAECEMWPLYQNGIMEVQIFPVCSMYFASVRRIKEIMEEQKVERIYLRRCAYSTIWLVLHHRHGLKYSDSSSNWFIMLSLIYSIESFHPAFKQQKQRSGGKVGISMLFTTGSSSYNNACVNPPVWEEGLVCGLLEGLSPHECMDWTDYTPRC